MRVEFPRKTREANPIGTRFRATVKVAQKHNRDGSLKGRPYLVATDKTIQLEKDFSPLSQIYAIPIGDRTYDFVEGTPRLKEQPLPTLREQAYEVAVDEVTVSHSETMTRNRSQITKTYALERSKGVCEACGNPY